MVKKPIEQCLKLSFLKQAFFEEIVTKIVGKPKGISEILWLAQQNLNFLLQLYWK